MPSATAFVVATEAALDAAIATINAASVPNADYVILITADLSLSTDIPPINLAAGDTLSIQGGNADNVNLSAVIDGGGARGFVVNSGTVSFSNLSLIAMTAPGGTGGVPGGGGALYVGAGAAVSATGVSFSADNARGGTAAGGAVFVAQGGTFSATGGSVAGSGSAAGNGIFIQGNNTITLTNETVTGVIADQTGAHLGSGSGAIIADGTVTLGGADTYTGGTQINGTLTLASSGAAGSGAISFGAATGDALVIAAGAPTNVIDGFVANPIAPSDRIDLQNIGLASGYTLTAGNQLTVIGSTGTAVLNLDPTQNYANDAFVLQPDAGTGTMVTVVRSDYLVATEADLNAALTQIDQGGRSAAPNVAYKITFTAGFALTTDLYAVNLANGSTLTIDGAGFTLDGGGKYRGFFDYAGGLTLANLTIQNAVAAGGSGGAGSAPGGGGAGLGDSNGGTLLTATDIANDYPPFVSGTGTVAGNDQTALNPLAGVTVSAVNTGQTETVTLTLSSTANGALSNLGGGSYDATTGVYTVTGTAAAVTTALDGLLFTPTIHEVAPGHVVSTQFSLSVTDGLMTAPATATTANITALNDPPVISGVPTTPVEGYWNVPLNPFPAVAITDPDVGATETVTLTASGGTLSLSMPGVTLTPLSSGTYALSAASPATVTAALDALQFTPVPNPSVPGYTISYVGLSVSDGIAPPVTSQVQVLAGLPIFTGIVASQTAVGTNPVNPFSTVAVTDSAGLTIQSLTITVFDSNSSYLTPTDANGVLSGANITEVGIGTYTLTPGSTAAVTAELDALVFTPSGAPLTTDFVLSAFDGATTADSAAIAVADTAVCFLAGTRIATPGGEVPVEQIAPGDPVMTASGAARSVVWVGTGRVLATRGRRTAATPVIIRKGALADNVPHHDLRVTKGHALYLDGVLIPVEFLVNHRSILWDDRAQEVELYHLELESHDVLLANGASAESYRDDGNRWLFRNANSGWGLPPQQPCAPVLTGGPIVDEIWRGLLDRTGWSARTPTTDEPDMHLVADGQRIDGRRGNDGAYRFRLPHPSKDVRLVSRSGVPCELGLARDPRPLGVALARVMLWQGARLRVIEASDSSLCEGFHLFEETNGFRWTDGDARLPATLFDDLAGTAELELVVAATASYPLFGEASVSVAA